MEHLSREPGLETDVAVIGYGGAGAAAAITAHDAGARVIVLEKMAEGGGNTRLSAGYFQSPLGIKAIDHIRTVCQGLDEEIIKAFVENARQNKGWIEGLGSRTGRLNALDICYPLVRSVYYPDVVGAQDIAVFRVESGHGFPGQALWQVLSANVERRGIRVMTNTPVKEIATNEKDEVTGVVAKKNGREVVVKAKRAVILACGGFEYDDALRADYLPLSPLYPRGNPGNTGDGIRMAQSLRAALWHMPDFSGNFVFKTSEYEAGFAIKIYGNRFIYITQRGKRFTDETGLRYHEAWKALCSSDRPNSSKFYAIFDEVTRKKGPLSQSISGLNRNYKWSLDNSKELAKGWLKRGKTIRKLAEQLSIDASVLEDALAHYSEYCQMGQDPDFGRSKETLERIDVPPYYAIELSCGLTNTLGGPRRDQEARIINIEGKPIPRLYSAGELGSIWSIIPAGGCNIGEALAFGRIAGRSAAAEPLLP